MAQPPLALVECHCADCQKVTGSSFSLGMPVMADAFELIKGELALWHRTGESGHRIPQRICGHCGTRLYSEPPSGAATLTARGGTLDDTSWLKPVAAIWTDSAQPGQDFSNVELTYPRQPEDFGQIIAKWRDYIAA
ncbi:MAG: GFA family protein [Pseudomonadota bacterium]